MNIPNDFGQDEPITIEPSAASKTSTPLPHSSRSNDGSAPHLISRWRMTGSMLMLGLSIFAVVVALATWQQLHQAREDWSTQSHQLEEKLFEATVKAQQASDASRELGARQLAQEARLSEVTMQREQLEELIQNFSRSRDENLSLDIESSLRLAEQQANLVGSPEPLLAALDIAQTRIARSANLKLGAVQPAIARDKARLQAASMTDVPAMIKTIDDLLANLDNLPWIDSVGQSTQKTKTVVGAKTAAAPSVWQSLWQEFSSSVRGLVQIQSIENPDIGLMTPEQRYFLRENLKLRLLNARLSILTHQSEALQADLQVVESGLQRYLNQQSPATQKALASIKQLRTQVVLSAIPGPESTLAALTAAVGTH